MTFEPTEQALAILECLRARRLYGIANREHAWLLRAEGLNNRQIASRMGVSRAYVSVMISQFGAEMGPVRLRIERSP